MATKKKQTLVRGAPARKSAASHAKKTAPAKAHWKTRAEKPKEDPEPDEGEVKSASKMIVELPPRALQTVRRLDKAHRLIEDTQKSIQELFQDMIDEIGTCSFLHPDHGPLSIMERGGRYFWRTKPMGRQHGHKVAKPDEGEKEVKRGRGRPKGTKDSNR